MRAGQPMYTHLEEPPVHSYSCLLEVVHPHKLEVEWPHSLVLCEGQCPQGAVEGTSCSCDLTLVYQELTVVQPDTRHLG